MMKRILLMVALCVTSITAKATETVEITRLFQETQDQVERICPGLKTDPLKSVLESLFTNPILTPKLIYAQVKHWRAKLDPDEFYSDEILLPIITKVHDQVKRETSCHGVRRELYTYRWIGTLPPSAVTTAFGKYGISTLSDHKPASEELTILYGSCTSNDPFLGELAKVASEIEAAKRAHDAVRASQSDDDDDDDTPESLAAEQVVSEKEKSGYDKYNHLIAEWVNASIGSKMVLDDSYVRYVYDRMLERMLTDLQPKHCEGISNINVMLTKSFSQLNSSLKKQINSVGFKVD